MKKVQGLNFFESTDFETLPGRGVCGIIHGVMYFGGNGNLMKERGVVVEDFAKEAIERGSVVKIDLASPAPPRRFFVVYLKKLPLSAAGRKMLEMLGGDVSCRL